MRLPLLSMHLARKLVSLSQNSFVSELLDSMSALDSLLYESVMCTLKSYLVVLGLLDFLDFCFFYGPPSGIYGMCDFDRDSSIFGSESLSSLLVCLSLLLLDVKWTLCSE